MASGEGGPCLAEGQTVWSKGFMSGHFLASSLSGRTDGERKKPYGLFNSVADSALRKGHLPPCFHMVHAIYLSLVFWMHHIHTSRCFDTAWSIPICYTPNRICSNTNWKKKNKTLRCCSLTCTRCMIASAPLWCMAPFAAWLLYNLSPQLIYLPNALFPRTNILEYSARYNSTQPAQLCNQVVHLRTVHYTTGAFAKRGEGFQNTFWLMSRHLKGRA